jgi:hypothetical protein
MASTIQLQTTINWSSSYVNYEELNIATSNEPAISNANTILQTIVGPPFKWNWNRTYPGFGTITCVPGTQDYPLSISTFGFLEGATATLSGSSFAIKEIKQELTVGTEPGRPQSIAPQFDNNSGTITFRFLPVPDQAYSVVPYGQNSPPLFTTLAQTWAPIPDKFEYLYNWGFLALSMAYTQDERFPIFNQKFVAHLLGAQQGLSETERNMFLDSWNILTSQNSLAAIKQNQGRQALGT